LRWEASKWNEETLFNFNIVALGWYGNYYFKQHPLQQQVFSETNNASVQPLTGGNVNTFQCDGRTHCSQMTSCAEATFFIRNCPNTKMDGNNDGVPCEKQWCH
jgi:hypothetical protein